MIVQRNLVRQRILDAAMAEFLESGYQNASMRAIAAQAGMTVGNVYLYFSSKSELFRALLEPTLQEVHRLIAYNSDIMHGAVPKDFTEFTKSLCEIFFNYRHPFLLLVEGSTGSPFEHYRANLHAAARERIVEAMAQARPPATADEPLLDAVVTALVEGILRMFTHHAQDSEALQRSLHRFITCTLGALFPNILTGGVPCDD